MRTVMLLLPPPELEDELLELLLLLELELEEEELPVKGLPKPMEPLQCSISE